MSKVQRKTQTLKIAKSRLEIPKHPKHEKCPKTAERKTENVARFRLENRIDALAVAEKGQSLPAGGRGPEAAESAAEGLFGEDRRLLRLGGLRRSAAQQPLVVRFGDFGLCQQLLLRVHFARFLGFGLFLIFGGFWPFWKIYGNFCEFLIFSFIFDFLY